MIGDAELADVVEQGGHVQGFQFFFGQAQFAADGQSANLHAAQMHVGGLVTGVNGEGQGFERIAMELCEFFFAFDNGVAPTAVAAVECE